MKGASFALLLLPFLIFLLLETSDAQCAPRSLGISFKSNGETRLGLYSICANGRRGALLYNFPGVRCGSQSCDDDERCKFCTTRLNATDVPPGDATTRYGIFFDDKPVPAYNFTADWSSNACAPDWYARNGWLAGGAPRFGCLSRGSEVRRDVFIVAQACSTSLYLHDNVAIIQNCLVGNWSSGVPKGQVYGEDCPARPL